MRVVDYIRLLNRRRFLQGCAAGLGSVALGHLLGNDGRTATASSTRSNPTSPKPPEFRPTAKNVIFIFMTGGPSHVDLFDPKPELQRWHGKPLPETMTAGLPLAFVKPNTAVMGSPRTFRPHKTTGTEFSDLLPNIGSCAEDLCLVRSMHTDAFNHGPAESLLVSGITRFGHPSMGSWISYGLGSESQTLPAFVVLNSGVGPNSGSNLWSSGFLPSSYSGTPLRSTGDPTPYLTNPDGVDREIQKERIDAVRFLNEQRLEATGDSEIASRIASYELAFRMQAAVPDLLDLRDEPEPVLDAYGINQEPTRAYGSNCLLARRLVERGVRFVLVMHGDWDHHDNINRNLEQVCGETDQPTAALVKDLKQRGLLEDTLLVWGGEFGRTPMGQMNITGQLDSHTGRDHHPSCFSMLLTGGGIRVGQAVGRTDEFGIRIEEDPIHVHDLQATILQCLGIDHTHLTYRHMGRDFRLTDVGGRVVNKLLI